MTPENEVFRLAEICLGPKFNKGRVMSFAESMYTLGQSEIQRSQFGFDRDIREILKRSAVPLCHSCDGTGVFYGNVNVCPCTFDSRNNTQLADRMAKNAQINALFKGVPKAHMALVQTSRLAIELFRSYIVVKGVRYWYHAESECLFTTETEQEAVDMLKSCNEDLLELDRTQFCERLKTDLEKRVSRNPDDESDGSDIDEEL